MEKITEILTNLILFLKKHIENKFQAKSLSVIKLYLIVKQFSYYSFINLLLNTDKNV